MNDYDKPLQWDHTPALDAFDKTHPPKEPRPPNGDLRFELTGLTVLRVWKGAVYLRLPDRLSVPIDVCHCDYCKAHPNTQPRWDTLCVELTAGGHTWTCHAPEWTVDHERKYRP